MQAGSLVWGASMALQGRRGRVDWLAFWAPHPLGSAGVGAAVRLAARWRLQGSEGLIY